MTKNLMMQLISSKMILMVITMKRITVIKKMMRGTLKMKECKQIMISIRSTKRKSCHQMKRKKILRNIRMSKFQKMETQMKYKKIE